MVGQLNYSCCLIGPGWKTFHSYEDQCDNCVNNFLSVLPCQDDIDKLATLSLEHEIFFKTFRRVN